MPTPPRLLSKSKLLAYRQCPRRLWLELHRPEWCEDSPGAQASFQVGHQVGEVARRLFDPNGVGALIDPKAEGWVPAFERTRALLGRQQPIFEAAFEAEGALALADVLLPVRAGRRRAWRMVEVKSSTEVKGYHRDDAAIQAFVARAAGVPLHAIAVACVDKTWRYPGGGDYAGLLAETDLTDEAFGRADEVRGWVAEAQRIARKRVAPQVATGPQCSEPYACGFLAHCQSQEPQTEFPVAWLPRVQAKALKEHIAKLRQRQGAADMRDVPDELLNNQQQRVKAATVRGQPFFDAAGAARALAAHKLPAYFMDFETVMFAVPAWKGTRPYQQVPFQFSVHRVGRNGKARHTEFLDLSGRDPRRAFAQALIEACGERGPVFVYNEGFERSRLKELAEQSPRLAAGLQAIAARLVDLRPVAVEHFYAPSQQGSWSLKAVLPATCPDLRYDALDGVQNGGMAVAAYLEATAKGTAAARKAEIRQQLLRYCGLDTWAMVRLWSHFSGHPLQPPYDQDAPTAAGRNPVHELARARHDPQGGQEFGAGDSPETAGAGL